MRVSAGIRQPKTRIDAASAGAASGRHLRRQPHQRGIVGVGRAGGDEHQHAAFQAPDQHVAADRGKGLAETVAQTCHQQIVISAAVVETGGVEAAVRVIEARGARRQLVEGGDAGDADAVAESGRAMPALEGDVRKLAGNIRFGDVIVAVLVDDVGTRLSEQVRHERVTAARAVFNHNCQMKGSATSARDSSS